MGNKKQMAVKVILEIVSVVFAVLLALGLNHWREDQSNKAMAERALTTVVIEIYTNKIDLKEELSLFQRNITLLEESRDLLEKQPKGTSTFTLKFNMPLLNNSAWNAANSTGAVKDFDFKILMELSDIYAFQQIYLDNGFSFFQEMNSLEFKKEENAKAAVSANLGQLKTFLSWSHQLNELYQSFLQDNRNQLEPLLPDSIEID